MKKVEQNDILYQTYLKILKDQLVPAMGCTEPIAIAYGAAKARELLGVIPDRVIVQVSSNILKNVKSVVVPNTNGLKGVEAAVAVGIVAGISKRILEVISQVSEEEKKQVKSYREQECIQVETIESTIPFDLILTLYAGNSYVKLRIAKYHTNIIYIEKDSEILFQMDNIDENPKEDKDEQLLNVKDIIEFADSVKIEEIQVTLDRQIKYNSAIAKEGLEHDYGANIGSVLLKVYGDDIKIRAKALPAAASDARMCGCELPVVINSGSGNQGLTASLPVIEYAKELNVSDELLYRALVVSNLITIHEKTGIGHLSAFCGAVCAGCGSGAGIAYLHGGRYDAIAHTLVNAVAIVSGIICDGAKPSCAAKIAASVDAGILGYHMYKQNQQFLAGDGIVAKGVEKTISNVGYLGRVGMKETDTQIMHLMLHHCN